MSSSRINSDTGISSADEEFIESIGSSSQTNFKSINISKWNLTKLDEDDKRTSLRAFLENV